MHFYKFDGAGNDFILLDTRQHDPQLTTSQIVALCHRRFGIGADGLMTLSNAPEGYDFLMRYYNSDGREASMCGNGGRCIVAFAHLLGIQPASVYSFLGPDGPHRATLLNWDPQHNNGTVSLGMHEVARDQIRPVLGGHSLDTGSPHLVLPVSDLEHYDVAGEGRRIRNLLDLWPQGTNVDFVETDPDGTLHIRTYERGVEDETWACGTGVTAAALVTGIHNIHARGGQFTVDFHLAHDTYTDITLTGPISLNFIAQLPN